MICRFGLELLGHRFQLSTSAIARPWVLVLREHILLSRAFGSAIFRGLLRTTFYTLEVILLVLFLLRFDANMDYSPQSEKNLRWPHY
jgi:hypothetical protein